MVKKTVFKDVTLFTEIIDDSTTQIYKAQKEITSAKVDEIIVKKERSVNFAKKVQKRFNENLKSLTPQQAKFAYDCALLIDSKLKCKNPIVIPAKAGFGKSTLIRTIIETKIDELKKFDSHNWGAVIISDRLEDLEKLKLSVRESFGYYDEARKVDWIFVIQSWNPKVCKNDSIKEYHPLNCSPERCSMWDECTITSQIKDQFLSPIVAFTNIRLFNYSSRSKKIGSFQKWQTKKGAETKREILIIDERPKLEITDSFDIATIEKLQQFVKNNKFFSIEVKTILEKELTKVKAELARLEYENIEKENELILNNSDIFSDKFKSTWQLVKSEHRYTLDTVESFFKNGGIWCKTAKRNFFKICEYSKMNWQSFRTYIFDATGETDPTYRDDFIFIDINDYKLFEHLHFYNVPKCSLSKDSLKDDEAKLDVIANWIKTEIAPKGKTFVVTYQEYSKYLYDLLKDTENIIFVKDKEGKDTIPYFGNTKGKNDFRDCINMIQVGWNRYPSDEYIASFLSVYGNFDEIKPRYFQQDEELLEEIKTLLTIDNKGVFKHAALEEYKLFRLVSELEQETFRTNLREFAAFEDINVYLFNTDRRIQELIKQRFVGCSFEDIKISGFAENKRITRKGSESSKQTAFINWLSSFQDEKLSFDDLTQELGISKQYMQQLIKENHILEQMNKFDIAVEKQQVISKGKRTTNKNFFVNMKIRKD